MRRRLAPFGLAPLTLAPLVLAFCAASAGAVEHRLRLALQALPTDYDITVEGEIAGLDFEDSDDGSYDSAGRLALGWSGRFGQGPAAFALGAGLAFSGSEGEEFGSDWEVAETGLWVEPGVSLRLAPWFDLEAGLLLGAGSTTVESEASDEDEEGGYAEAALLVRAVFVIRRLELALEAGPMARWQRFSSDDDAYEVDTEIDVAGALVGLAIGFRL